ncbi:hypothetical protein [Mucilaginibacter gracilis]|uniref:hypothetical protein n=1 Tax=Mucilaginibacter gracilis TaxID=423350 RepID=UPI0013C2FCBE|nr:hypothetical protein [Mucilaginibacter gracilis]
MLNGQLIPAPNSTASIPFDIIPANMVENVVVSKTITPDLSAEFGGGLVGVETKTIPTEIS